MLVRLLLAGVVLAASPRTAFERLAPAISKEVGEPVRVHVERIAGTRVDFDVVYREGGSDRFVGYADGDRVSWLTACFVREFYGRLCGAAPRGARSEGVPEWILPARFAHPTVPGLIRPEALAVAKDGSLLIADSIRAELFRRAPDGSLHLLTPIAGWATPIAVAPDGSVYVGEGKRVHVLAHGSERTLPQRFVQVSSLAFFKGHLYVGTGDDIVEFANGKAATVVRPIGFFSPDLFAIGGNGDFYVYSSGTKTIEQLTRSGKKVHEWQAYAHGLATAPDGSIVVGTQGGQLLRIRDGKLTTVADLGSGRPFGFPFQEDGVAVGTGGTIYTDTFVGNGYTNQTALAAVDPDGRARLLRTTTPLAATLPPGMTTGCPSPAGLRAFDSAAREQAVRAAEVVDMPPFDRGLRLTDPSWWAGFYTDQIDGRYGIGRHHVYIVGPAAADPYSGAVSRRCGASLVDRSLAVVVGRGVYSDQVSHMYFLDRNGRALLYWQHT